MEADFLEESALSGVRVLDLADESGSYCGRLLANLGADVLKVEPPGGAPARHRGPFFGDDPDPERSLPFFFFNADKRGVTLNLGSADGRELFRRLVQGADVVVETYPPGHLESLGLGYETLSRLRPGLILTSISPFGQRGPYAQWQASDIVAVAIGGLMNMAGYPHKAPAWPPCNQAYYLAGLHGAVGTLIALFHRRRTGRGQHVDVSMQASVALATGYMVQYWELCRRIIKRTGGASPDPNRGGRNVFQCKDGYITGAALGGDRGWTAMLEWMVQEGGAEDLTEERWQDADYRRENRPYLDEVWQRFLLNYTREQVVQVAQRARVPIMPIQTIDELFQDPQLLHRDFFVALEHPGLGTIRYPGPPFRLSESPWQLSRPAPRIGEHNRQVYLEELGLTEGEFSVLRQAGVI